MSKTTLRKVTNGLLAFAFYAVIFLIYTDPLINFWDVHIIGVDDPQADTQQILSNLYLFEKGWEQGSLFYTHDFFYPLGASTLMHGYTPGMGFLYMISGMPVFAFLNTFVLLAFCLGGLGAFFLAKRLNPSFFPALFTGFVFSFSCFHLGQYQDHYWYVINFTLPWYLLVFPAAFDFHPRHGILRVASWKAVLACLLLGIVSVSLDYYTTFFLLYLSLFYALWKRWEPERLFAKMNWKWVLGGLVLLVLVSQGIDVLKRSGLDDKHGLYWSGDVAGLFIPQNSRMYEKPFEQLATASWTEPGPAEKNLFLGFSFILLLGVTLWMHQRTVRDRTSRNLLLASVLLLALCFPVFKLFGHTLLKLPTALLHYIPFLNNIRVPTRWGILVYLFLGLYTVRVWRYRKYQGLVFALLLIAVVTEYFPSTYSVFPTNQSSEHRIGDPYHGDPDIDVVTPLLEKEEGKVLLTLPFGVRDGYRQIGFQDSRHLYAQTLHGKQMLGGYFSRLDGEVFQQYEDDALCRDLFRLIEGKPALENPKNYPAFFTKFRPDLLWVTEAYSDHAAFRKIEEAVGLTKGVSLKPVGPGLWRFRYAQ